MRRGARRARGSSTALQQELERSGIIAPDSIVLVAVSGGVDSVCLLHSLHFAPDRPRLIAAHFDHRMRPDSGRDAEWVRGLCRAWSIPLVLGEADTPCHSEADGRAQRYRFLERAADQHGANFVVTGHQADDQAETVLFRLARGTGLAGLAGIAARRGRIIRPLLGLSRTELLAYARVNGLTWRQDPTNRDLKYARNWIRARVLPALEVASPGATQRIAALATRAAEAEAGWNSVVLEAVQNVVIGRDESTLTLARDRLLVYHPHVRVRVIRHLLHDFGSSPGRVGTSIALRFISSGASGAQVQLAGGVALSREFDRLLLQPARSDSGPAEASLAIRSPEAGAGSFRAGGRQYAARWVPVGRAGTVSAERRPEAERTAHWPGGESPHTSTASFDPAALRFPLELRGWRPGDRIRLRDGSKKLKELFRERRIGRASRARVPVLLDADGRVVWVVGIARAHEAPDGPSNHVLEISVTDGDIS